jgi:hypothetical protein
MPYCRIDGITPAWVPLCDIDTKTAAPAMGPKSRISCIFTTQLDIDINLVYLFSEKWGGGAKKKRA